MSQGDSKEQAKINMEPVPFYDELVSKRREVIDLTAELDRAKRKINELEYNTQAQLNHIISLSEAEEKYELAIEAWQEKVDYLEEELAIKQINQWYLRPLFLLSAGFALATVIISFFVRW